MGMSLNVRLEAVGDTNDKGVDFQEKERRRTELLVAGYYQVYGAAKPRLIVI